MALSSLEGDLAKKVSWLRLMCTESVGAITFKHLLEKFGSASAAIQGLPTFSSKVGRIKPLKIPSIEWAEKYIEKCQKAGVHLVAAYEDKYPKRLLTILNYPPILHVRCKTELLRQDFLNKPSVAIVGARNASLQGISFANKIAKELAQNGFITISGLARGIDTAAHKTTLETGTIAVVANGVDVVYPSENAQLYNQIAENGVIISEALMGKEPRPQSFGYRNRIVSGMSMGVVVIEAAAKSGSLITANYAAEQGRDVFAVPGHPFDPRSHGSNNLIRNGAILIQNADDVLEYLASNSYEQTEFEQTINMHVKESIENYDEQIEELKADLQENLSNAPITIDDLLLGLKNQLGKDVAIHNLQSALAELELAGFIEIDGNSIIKL